MFYLVINDYLLTWITTYYLLILSEQQDHVFYSLIKFLNFHKSLILINSTDRLD